MKNYIFISLVCLFVVNQSSAQDPDLYFRDQQLKKQEDEKVIADWPIDPKSKQILFSEVVNVDNATAKELYSRAKLFVADAYKSSKAVTDLNDDEAKIVLIKPMMKVTYKDFLTSIPYFVQYQLKIECKDNRYRYSVEGHTLIVPSNRSTTDELYSFTEKKPFLFSKKSWIGLQNQAILDTKIIIGSLKLTMSKSNSDF